MWRSCRLLRGEVALHAVDDNLVSCAPGRLESGGSVRELGFELDLGQRRLFRFFVRTASVVLLHVAGKESRSGDQCRQKEY